MNCYSPWFTTFTIVIPPNLTKACYPLVSTGFVSNKNGATVGHKLLIVIYPYWGKWYVKQCPIEEYPNFVSVNIPGHSVFGQTLCSVTRRCLGVWWAHVGDWRFIYVSLEPGWSELVVGNDKWIFIVGSESGVFPPWPTIPLFLYCFSFGGVVIVMISLLVCSGRPKIALRELVVRIHVMPWPPMPICLWIVIAHDLLHSPL